MIGEGKYTTNSKDILNAFAKSYIGDGKSYMGESTKTMYVNAMLVEVSAIPHNKKVFYKTMQQSLKNAVNYI
jgi:hypothetical protein